MTQEPKHTPTPYHYAFELSDGYEQHVVKCSYGSILATFGDTDEGKANAFNMILTCNAHDELFKALENLVSHYDSKDGDMKLHRHFISEARTALAKARGEE